MGRIFLPFLSNRKASGSAECESAFRQIPLAKFSSTSPPGVLPGEDSNRECSKDYSKLLLTGLREELSDLLILSLSKFKSESSTA